MPYRVTDAPTDSASFILQPIAPIGGALLLSSLFSADPDHTDQQRHGRQRHEQIRREVQADRGDKAPPSPTGAAPPPSPEW